MVARIFTGETPVQELQREFREELQDKMKEAAVNLGCEVEELAYRFANDGVIEITRMTADEIARIGKQEQQQKNVIDIKKSRGVFDE